jgi:galactonate dehydratase
MRIEALDIRTAGTSWRNLILVRLTTDDGLSGWGEATIEYGDRALLAYLPEIFARAVKGRDSRDIEGLMASMVRADYWRSGFIARTAFSAIELACWDICAKELGLPVWRLVGAKRTDPLPAYANGWYRSERDPELIAEAALAVLAKGYRALKIDPFGAGERNLTSSEFDKSMAIIGEVRRAVGDEVEIFIEGHGRFDLAFALRIACAMEPFRLGFFEEPLIPELNHHLPELVRGTSIPIALGERLSSPDMFERLLKECDRLILQPDLCHVGGLRAAREVARMAADRGWRVAPHNAGGPLASTQTTHFSLVTPAVMVQEVFDDFEEPWVRESFPGRVTCEGGQMVVPEAPGFGVEPREELLATHPFKDRHLDLFEEGWEQRRVETLR